MIPGNTPSHAMILGGLSTPRPRLKPNVDAYRHIYRGAVWYVFHDRAAHRYYRISADGAAIVAAMDGQRDLAEICEQLRRLGPHAAPDLPEAAGFLSHLAALDLLQTDGGADPAGWQRRHTRETERRMAATLRSPMSFRVGLIDPTYLLDRALPWLSWVFGRFGLALWLAVVVAGGIVGVRHWDELSTDVSDHLLSAENLALGTVVYIVIKVVHEMMHGLALRRCGCEVRRIGLIFTALMPIPYVEATASNALERRRDRILIDAAGIMIELFLGCCALLIWASAAPGFLRLLCFEIVMISGFSTLLFNGNPLQRYDGYYIMSDLVGIPSLGMRSAQYLNWLVQRHLFGNTSMVAPAATRSESIWFVIYAPLSFIYRIGMLLLIAFYVSNKYRTVGLIMAVWTVVGFLWPLGQTLWRGVAGPGPLRATAQRRVAMLAAGLAALLFLLPLPYGFVTQAVVVMPDAATIRAGVSGTVAAVLVAQGASVRRGDPVLRLASTEIVERLAQAEARVAELQAVAQQALPEDRVRFAIVTDAMARAVQDRQDAQQDASRLVVRAAQDGVAYFPNYADLFGSYVAKGAPLATVWDAKRAVLRTLIPMEEIGLVRERLRNVAVRLGDAAMQPVSAALLDIVPEATDVPPSVVLTLNAGGPFAVMSGANGQPHLREAMFQADLRTDSPIAVPFLNGRADVRFNLGWQPGGLQIWRGLKLVFLRQLHA